MSRPSFRFLHAACLRLEEPLRGVGQVPEELAKRLIEAPFSSAEAVFSAAIREEVDFVVLAGDVFDPLAAGAHAIVFLQQQFAKLAAVGIRVYWAASHSDSNSNWIRTLDWPDNVYLFAAEQVGRLEHFCGEELAVVIRGRSWHAQRPLRAAELAAEPADGFRLAILPGQAASDLPHAGSDYWALGGSSSATTPVVGTSFVHCPGSPQGRESSQSGPYGCTLVSVTGEGEVRTRMIRTDVVCWCQEELAVEQGASRNDLRGQFRRRAQQLLAAAERPLLVRWTLTGEGRFESVAAQDAFRQELLDWLREEFSSRSPGLWSLALVCQPLDQLPRDWCEEDSILGDYLRTVLQHQEDPRRPITTDLEGAEKNMPGELVRALALTDVPSRQAAIRDAALLGADLLRGEDAWGRREN